MRGWYEKEAAEQTWSVRTLQRNISLQYYYRLLKSQIKKPVKPKKQAPGQSSRGRLMIRVLITDLKPHSKQTSYSTK